ncbi:MAG: CNNM domain-containing protein [Kiritimatiellia bacterium]|jgi:CBS domain containing-hemolysin-like protein|nr:CNNM domain-containing protein [Kiritimatiellia bacterium]
MIASQLILLAFCLLGAAYFAGIETGIIAINRLRLQHLARRRVRGALIIRNFLAHPDRLLGTTLTATNLLYVISSVTAASLGRRLYGALGTAVAGVLLVILVLVFCEYIPKAFFQASPARRVLPLAHVLQAADWILRPITFLVTTLLHWVMPRDAGRDVEGRMLVSREELLHLAREGTQTGVLTPHESEMIHGIFDLTHKTCETLMTPREKMAVVLSTATAQEILDLARHREFNRLPVYDAAQKTFVGVVHIFDILSDEAQTGKTAADYMRPPQLVASYLPIDHLLPRMRVTRLPLFLVTDDRYEVIGLITLEDVLCEVTGEE